MHSNSLYDALERMAQYGTAPEEVCSLFGVGLDDPLARLKKVYFDNAFSRGRSAEKFVVGPFGSGKTHFLRQLQEVAYRSDCAVAEVQLNRDVDFTDPLAVYQEIAAEIQVPDQPTKGLQSLLRHAAERLRDSADNEQMGNGLLLHFSLETAERVFELECLGRMYARAFQAQLDGETEHFELVCRWLAGGFGDRSICKFLGVAPISKPEHRRYGHKAALSLYQLIKSLGYTGTLVCLDEAEQSLDVDRKRMQTVLSTLQSGINAAADLKDGAVLIVFAITPDVADKLKEFPALQQRLVDPGPGMGFFEGRFTILRGDFGVGEGGWAAFDIVANEIQVEFRIAAQP